MCIYTSLLLSMYQDAAKALKADASQYECSPIGDEMSALAQSQAAALPPAQPTISTYQFEENIVAIEVVIILYIIYRTLLYYLHSLTSSWQITLLLFEVCLTG